MANYSENQTAFREGTSDGSDATQEAMQKLRETATRVDERVREIVRDHPFAALGGAIAIGFVIGRILSKD
jgi:ElaB/YqjD/DUF883 family membrane-anchored ribosome-binding protein